MNGRESITHFIVQRVTEETTSAPRANPTVLSCGGMYLPRPKTKTPFQKISYDILNLANQSEPAKVFTGQRPLNMLMEALSKEILN